MEANEINEDKDETQIVAKFLGKYMINNKIRIAKLNYYGHINRSGQKRIFNSVSEFKIHKPKKMRKPAYTWRTCIRQDVDRSGITLKEWQDKGVY